MHTFYPFLNSFFVLPSFVSITQSKMFAKLLQKLIIITNPQNLISYCLAPCFKLHSKYFKFCHYRSLKMLSAFTFERWSALLTPAYITPTFTCSSFDEVDLLKDPFHLSVWWLRPIRWKPLSLVRQVGIVLCFCLLMASRWFLVSELCLIGQGKFEVDIIPDSIAWYSCNEGSKMVITKCFRWALGFSALPVIHRMLIFNLEHF